MGRKQIDKMPDILYNYSSLQNEVIREDILDNISNNKMNTR